MAKGLFLTFEGGDGCGKTTALNKLMTKLTEEGYDVIYTREPGGIDIAEQIRNVILDVKNTAMDERTEALLYAASRRQHLVQKILPALEQGKIILCDRFIDSSLAYQGYARNIGMEEVFTINKFAIDTCMPDLTLYYDLLPEIGLARINANRNEKMDRLDGEKLEFHKRVYDGYHILTKRYPERIKTIDASKSIEEVFEQTYKLVKEKISQNV